MTVRRRLVLSALVMAAPLAIVLVSVRHRILDGIAIRIYVAVATSHMLAGGRSACEAAPERWSPRLRVAMAGTSRWLPGAIGREQQVPTADLRVRAVDLARRSGAAGAWVVSPELARDVLAGEPAAARIRADGPPREREVLIRMPWRDGPCANLLVRATEPAGAVEALLGPPGMLIGPPLLVLLAMLVGVGPLVHRIRALTSAVRASARQRYVPSVSLRGGDELSELARAFDSAGMEIRAQIALQERQARALREFLASSTHDLAVPLTVLQGHLAALQEGLGNEAPASRADLVGAMREVQYVRALLGNLTLAAQLDTGAPQPMLRPVDLAALVERVVQRHRIVARQLDIGLERALPAEPVFALGDVTMIEQAVGNVVLNAVRYNEAGGHVAVLLEVSEPGRFRLRTLDDGPGLTSSELERLLERHARGDSARARVPDGQGLGLHIALRVATLHGFRLRLDHAAEGGLDAVLEGPTCPPAAQLQAVLG